MLVFRLAWRSFVRHRRRSIITGAAIALGLAMILVFVGLAEDAHLRMADMGVHLGAGHVLVQGRGFQQEQTLDYLVRDPDRVAERARALPHVTAVVPRVHAGGLVVSGELSAAVVVVGVDPELEPRVSTIAGDGKRVAGAYLRPRTALEFERQPADIYIGDKLARTLEVEVDDRVVLTMSPVGAARPASAAFYVRGIFHTGLTDLDGFFVQIPLVEAQRMLAIGDAVTQLAVLADELDHTAPVTTALRAQLAGDRELEVLPWQQALRELHEAIVLDDAGNYMMLGIIFIIVLIGIFNTVLMSVIERTREFGVMLAIGTSTRRLFATVMAEAAILAVVSAAAGLVIGLALHTWLATTGLDIQSIYGDLEFAGVIFEGRVYSTLTNFQIVGWTIVVMILVVLSALYPAWRATRLKPVEAMRHA